MLDLRFYKVQEEVVGKSRMPMFRTAGIFGDWGDMWLSIKRADARNLQWWCWQQGKTFAAC
jgi:hypothetical protein